MTALTSIPVLGVLIQSKALSGQIRFVHCANACWCAGRHSGDWRGWCHKCGALAAAIVANEDAELAKGWTPGAPRTNVQQLLRRRM